MTVPRNSLRILAVLIVFIFLPIYSIGDSKFGSNANDHETPKRPDKPISGIEHPADELGEDSDENSACPVSPEGLARFANGESFQHKNLVTYITTPACFTEKRIRSSALRYGIEFNKKLPLNFDSLSQNALSNDSETRIQTEAMLKQSVQSLLRTYPMSQRELLPFIGQLALLSPAAARNTLSTYILREISAASPSRTEKSEFPPELGRRLMELGAAETSVSTEISTAIEDMALAAQASGLLGTLKGLSAAAISEKGLSPIYSAGVAALSRGIERGNIFYTPQENREMQKVLFFSLVSALPLMQELPSTASDFDNGFKTLIKDKTLKQTALNNVWVDVLSVLASQESQPVLANALAKSLTPEVVYLGPQVRSQLFEAAHHYPVFATPIQNKFLQALRTLARQVKSDPQKKEGVNEIKTKYLGPFFESILEWSPEEIQPLWLLGSLEAGFFNDELIEKNFPKFVLYQIKRIEKNVSAPPFEALSEQFGALWALSQIEVPVLQKWINKNEKK